VKPCVKCGSADINTAFVAAGTPLRWFDDRDKWPDESNPDPNYFGRWKRDALLRTCRGCGFRWADATLDAANAKNFPDDVSSPGSGGSSKGVT